MNGTVITITSGKGGVGKTTTTANIGVALSRMGRRVVCIDGDIGLRNLDAALGFHEKVANDIVDVAEGRARLMHALVEEAFLPNLMLLPASQDREHDSINQNQMDQICRELRSSFDYVLIDCPAGIEMGFRHAVTPADQVIVVVTPEIPSIRDGDRVIGLVEGMGKSAPRLIVNHFRSALSHRGELMDISGILDILGIELIGVVPEDEHAIAAGNKGVPLTWRANSPAAIAFTQIAQRLLGDPVPVRYALPQVGLFGQMTRLFGF